MNQETKKMGFFSLFAMGLGNVIGSGVFTMIPIAMGSTGKSTSLACIVGALLCLLATTVPAMFLSSAAELSGGSYSQGAFLFPKLLAGVNGVLGLFGQLTFAGAIVSLTAYLVQMIPGLADSQKLVSFILLIAFFLLGIKGVKTSSTFQNVTVVILLLSLAAFIVGGLPHVDFGTYFSENYFADGLDGFVTSSTLLVFCSIGGSAVLSFTSEAKDPKRTIPLATFLCTAAVAVIYFLIAIVASGILPYETVATAMNLGIVAETFMSTPMYMFFMIGGAVFALGTTVNSMVAAFPYPVQQMAKEGWLPAAFMKRDSKFNYPYVTMAVAFVIGGILPIIFGLDVSQISTIAASPVFIALGVLALATMRLPKLYPEHWEKSIFHVPTAVLNILMVICALCAFFLGVKMMIMNGKGVAIGTVILVIIVVLYCQWRIKSGKVHMSYGNDK